MTENNVIQLGHFNRAFSIVIGHEGGYVNDPHDPGGETNFGISKRQYPHVNIAALTLDRAKEIYWRDYWLPMQCDALDWPVNVLVFDSAVNQGHSAAAKMLQGAARVKRDGYLGPITLSTVAQADKRELCARFLAKRAVRYAGTRGFDRYGDGWMTRLFLLASDVL